jgi:hypothetical protein
VVGLLIALLLIALVVGAVLLFSLQ